MKNKEKDLTYEAQSLFFSLGNAFYFEIMPEDCNLDFERIKRIKRLRMLKERAWKRVERRYEKYSKGENR